MGYWFQNPLWKAELMITGPLYAVATFNLCTPSCILNRKRTRICSLPLKIVNTFERFSAETQLFPFSSLLYSLWCSLQLHVIFFCTHNQSLLFSKCSCLNGKNNCWQQCSGFAFTGGRLNVGQWSLGVGYPEWTAHRGNHLPQEDNDAKSAESGRWWATTVCF